MAACVVCGQPLPPTSRRDRITCSGRCRKRRSRHSLALRPASALTWREAVARLALLDPARYGPLPPFEDDDPLDGDAAPAHDPLDGLPADDSLAGLLARLNAADDDLERLLARDDAVFPPYDHRIINRQPIMREGDVSLTAATTREEVNP